jgi:LemA protein
MKKLTAWFLGIGMFFFIVLGSAVGTYNGAISLRNTAETESAQIEADMQRRADLIPNLVASTKGAMSQEQAVFEDISKAHAAFTSAPSGTDAKFQAGKALSTAIRGYMVVAQQYPNLKSLDIVVQLNDEIAGTENRINYSRQEYNRAVKMYNIRIQSFPLNLVAERYGFEKMEQFQAVSTAKVAPTVSFEDMKD